MDEEFIQHAEKQNNIRYTFFNNIDLKPFKTRFALDRNKEMLHIENFEILNAANIKNNFFGITAFLKKKYINIHISNY